MRILLVIEATIGGTRRHIVDVAAGLARHAGVEVWLASSTVRDPNYRADLVRLQALGVRSIEIPMLRALRPLVDLRHLRRLESVLGQVRPDIVHTHCSKAGTLGRLASLATGIGVRIHTPHTMPFLLKNMFGPLQRQLFLQIEQQLLQITRRLVAVSATEAESFTRAGLGDPERLRVVPNGIEEEKWIGAAALSRQELGVPALVPLAIVAGLLNTAKGQDLALRALARPGLEQAHLLLAGHGEMDAELRQLALQLGVAERVRFLGWRDDVPRLFAAADLVLVPSRWEAMPYAALEALAAGKPVIATRVDGARELVRDGIEGALVDIEDVDALAKAWRGLVEAPLARRQALGRAGRERVAGRFLARDMVRNLMQVYREAL